MKLTEKALSRKNIFEGRVFTAHLDEVRLPDGNTALRECVEHHGGVAVLAIDREDHLMMVRQFRYGAGETLLELPAGKLEPEEDPAACAMRELREETGFSAKSLKLLAKLYPTPAYCSECIWVYLAEDLLPGRQQLDEGEFLSLERVPFQRALEWCLDGNSITDAKTLIGILKYAQLREGRA